MLSCESVQMTGGAREGDQVCTRGEECDDLHLHLDREMAKSLNEGGSGGSHVDHISRVGGSGHRDGWRVA